MNTSSSDKDPDRVAGNPQTTTARAQDKAHEALNTGQTYARENPILLASGALFFGIVIGVLCVSSHVPRRKHTAEVARDLVDDIITRISERLPSFKKQACHPASLLEQWQHAGKKLKWW